jgi:predicted nucleotidyltransferase component of viral defense system
MPMLDFEQIKAQYPTHMQGFDRALLREYLQYKVLQAIFESNKASKLAFLGGTALRILYGNSRFSEDIDLDNFDLRWQEFEEIIQKVKRFMELEGFDVEVRNVAKGAYRCYLRFPALLYEQGISPFRKEKILIQVDTFAQNYAYKPEIKIVNKFDIFTEVRVTPLNVILSQKIYTAVNRNKAKGRDFFDITFLFGITKPDLGFLKQKMGIDTPESLRQEILERINEYDFQELADDVAPFLLKKEQIKRVEKFREFWKQVEIA